MPNQVYSFLYENKRTGAYLGAIALGLSTLLLPSCTNLTRNEEIQQEKTNVTANEVSQLSGDAANSLGKMVTVRSTVTKAVGKSGFVMTPPDGKPILVINASGATFTLPGANVPVQATGQVEQLRVADIDKKYNLGLEPNLYVDYENQPAIVAQSLALAPTPENLYKAPAGYFNKEIAIKGKVRKLPNTTNGFAVFEDGWVDDIGIMVVGVDRNLQGGPIQEGEYVVVTGVARQPDAQVLQTANLGWDANKTKEFLARYTNRPVIVADRVYPSAVETK
ncbi:hypothetical protein [Allocoleopsis franciscana]|uniref:Uncharacterized protein n=1 Tax=Allocoleopsis franciscana PCC 7113 TaxID=1173027 RepID=K9WG14_9CYAN|nr:hypothetical protein [Allocoleopsis franciscana]AFZ18467.1 hypothetical protein Mic7113_2680 [Allocoleopsis franciscana PCC 7113]